MHLDVQSAQSGSCVWRQNEGRKQQQITCHVVACHNITPHQIIATSLHTLPLHRSVAPRMLSYAGAPGRYHTRVMPAWHRTIARRAAPRRAAPCCAAARAPRLRGWRNTVGNLIEMFGLNKNLSLASIYWHTRETRRGTVSSNSRCPTILVQQCSADRSPLQASLVLAFCMLQYSSSGSWPAGCKAPSRTGVSRAASGSGRPRVLGR